MDKGAIRITGYISPTSETDTYPTHLDKYGKGGYRVVDTIVSRDAISIERRSIGMMVYVISDLNTYQLIGGVENSNWREFTAISNKVVLKENYTLVGGSDGYSYASPVLIDVKHDIIDLKRTLDNFEELKKLDYNRIWIGDQDNEPIAKTEIGVVNLPKLGAAIFPYPSFIDLPAIPMPNPTFNPFSGFDWLMSGPWLPQIYCASVNTTNTSSETVISSALAMTQIKAAQSIKRLDVASFIVKNRNINFTWDNPAMLGIPEAIKQLYGLETSYTFSNAQALDELGDGLLKNSANGILSVAVGGTDYVTPAALQEETTARIEADSALETSIVALEGELQAQIAAITGYGSLALLTEFLANLGWTTGYSEYLWSKYRPLRTYNTYADTDKYDKDGGNLWYDANHIGGAGAFKPGLRITSWDSSTVFASDLFPVSMGLFGYRNQLGYVSAQEGFVWQSYMENDSSSSNYRFPKNFGMYSVGHDEGQIGWNRKETLLMEYKYYDDKFSYEKKVDFKSDVMFLSQGIKIPVGTTAQRPVNPTKGYFRLNTDAPAPGPVATVNIQGTDNQIKVTTIINNSFKLGFEDNVKFTGKSYTKIAVGTNADRPITPEAGMWRFNTSL